MVLSQPMRVRAARGAVNMSLDAFAEAIEIGRSTLVRIEAGEREAERHELERMSRVSGLPLAFFVVDLEEALDGKDEPGLRERVAQLERQVRVLRDGLATLSADSLRRTREQQARGEAGPSVERQGEGG